MFSYLVLARQLVQNFKLRALLQLSSYQDVPEHSVQNFGGDLAKIPNSGGNDYGGLLGPARVCQGILDWEVVFFRLGCSVGLVCEPCDAGDQPIG